MLQKLTENLTYFLYARKSSDSEDRQIQSIDDQINRIKELAKVHHFQIKEIFIEARSAKKPNNRPVFAEMISRIEKGEANGILCWEINRLSRNPIESGLLSWHLQQGTIKCIQTIDRKFLPDDNVVVFNVESSIANQYIIDLRKNCMRGMVGKAERGWKPSGAPLGYINDQIDRSIQPDQERFHLVRKMWDLMLTGQYSPMQIRSLANNEWGLRTKKQKHRGNKELCASYIYQLFTNIFYTGMFEWAGKIYQDKQIPMITIEEYDRVQILLGRKGRPRSKIHEFAYTGLIKCETCGSMYTADEKFKLIKSTGKLKSFIYYHCTRKRKHIVPKCSEQKPITLNDLESQIEKELTKYTILPEFYEWAEQIIEEIKARNKTDETEIQLSLENALKDTETSIKNLVKMRYKDQIIEDDYILEQNTLQKELSGLKHQLANISNVNSETNENLLKVFEFAAFALKHFVSGTISEKREILSSIGSNFSINAKILNINTEYFLIPIQNHYPTLETEYRRLELNKTLGITERNQQLHAIRLQWWTLIEDIRTIVNNNPGPIRLPNLKPPDQTKEPDTLLLAA